MYPSIKTTPYDRFFHIILFFAAVCFFLTSFAFAEAEAEGQAAQTTQPPAVEETQDVKPQASSEKPVSEEQTAKEPRLRFSFRFQAWADVLEWFADQADLALVLDAPIPGTFNYTDDNEYTPTEAIDLLNGVLLTKGYTLIRRDRMLMVVNLKDGIPEGIVPRVSIDDLKKRGRFEMVSVLLPLGRRNAEEINKEISPLLGPYGKGVPLAKTNQLLVTDTAGILQAIEAMIRSMPEPAEQEQPIQHGDGKIKKPGEPKLVVYPLKSADPKVAQKVLKTLLPDDKIVLDPKSKQINVFAAPAQQAVVKSVLAQMHARGSSLSDNVQIEVYRLTTVEPRAALAMLEKLLPESQFAVDPNSRSLIAIAPPYEQAAIRTTLNELQGESTGPNAVQLNFYPLERQPPAGLIAGLKQLAPRAKITLESGGRRLMVVAGEADHNLIRSTIDRIEETMSAGEKNALQTYSLSPAEKKRFNAILPTLRAEMADITVAADSEPGILSIWAKPAQHALLNDIIEQLKRDLPEDGKRRFAAYKIANLDPNAVLSALRGLLPEAQLSIDPRTRRLLAWCLPEQHKQIEDALQQMDAGNTPGSQDLLKVYPVSEDIDTNIAIQVLKQIIPGVPMHIDKRAGTIVARGSESDHKIISQTLGSMQDADTSPTVAKYRLGRLNVWSTLQMLRSVAPRAQFAVGADSRSIIVWARPEDQKRIEQTFQLVESSPDGKMAVYTLESTSAAAAIRVLAGAFPDARFAVGTDSRQLVAWATAKDHERLAEAVKQMSKTHEQETQVYYFRTADPRAAINVLRALIPSARMAVNVQNRSIAVTARAADHEKIKAAVEQIDRESDAAQALEMQAHRIRSADPVKLLAMLRTFFRRQPEIQLSLDDENETLMALAPPRDHKKIESLIAEVEKGSSSEFAPKVEAYSLKNVDARALEDVLRKLLKKDMAKVQLSVDPRSGQLVAIAKQKYQDIIRQTVERMRTEEQTLEIFQLNVVDPSTATLAIDRLFDSGGYGYDPTAPVVDVDDDTQQLFVSATKEQHEKIRDLLVKMGETNLQPGGEHHKRTVRVVPFRGDARAAVEEIRRLWPQLRDNPINIVEPNSNGTKAEGQKSLKNNSRDEKPQDKAASKSAPGRMPIRLVSAEKRQPAKQEAEDKSPVTLVVGDNSITVKSDDPQALEEMESLLKSLSPAGFYGRNMAVFPLRNTDAVSVAERLQSMLREMRPRWQRYQSGTMIVADERLNAIIVKASRADRSMIESMVRILDSPASDQAVQAGQPTIINVKNTEASRVERVVSEVFRAQLSGAARRGGRGGSSRWTPRVSVDDTSNSLVVVAAPALLAQIEELVEKLDTAAGEESVRGMKIISLKKANASRVQKALDAAIQRASRRGRR